MPPPCSGMTLILHLHKNHLWSPANQVVVVFGRRVQRNRVTQPVSLVSVDVASASVLYVHFAEPAAQATDPHLSFVPSLSVVTAAAPAEYFAVDHRAQVDAPAPLFAP